jgi:hypothetical protein
VKAARGWNLFDGMPRLSITFHVNEEFHLFMLLFFLAVLEFAVFGTSNAAVAWPIQVAICKRSGGFAQ